MGMLHEDEFVAFDGGFRQPIHHREDAVMVTRRNRFEKPTPCRLGCRQREGRRLLIGGDLPFDEIENHRVVSRPAKQTPHGPAQVLSTASAAQAFRQEEPSGNPVIAS